MPAAVVSGQAVVAGATLVLPNEAAEGWGGAGKAGRIPWSREGTDDTGRCRWRGTDEGLTWSSRLSLVERRGKVVGYGKWHHIVHFHPCNRDRLSAAAIDSRRVVDSS